jgi:hypothetical protein
MVPARHKPDIELLRHSFNYDPETGELTWKNPRSIRVKVGDLCGCPDGKGYLTVRICTKLFFVHRVAWALVNGRWPENDIDHINGDGFDNRIQNLRSATKSQNLCNQKLSSRNKSGVKGVWWATRQKKWKARVIVNKKQYHAGYFDSISAARNAVQDLRKSLHGEYARHQ